MKRNLGISAALTACLFLGLTTAIPARATLIALEATIDGAQANAGAGTGSPYFTTDTAAVLRGQEIHAEILLKATKVDGVYDADPVSDTSAKILKHISYMEVLEKQLKVMDMTAISLAMDNQLPLAVFKLKDKGNIVRVICGENVGTLINH